MLQEDLATSWKERFDVVEKEQSSLVERLSDSEALVSQVGVWHEGMIQAS